MKRRVMGEKLRSLREAMIPSLPQERQALILGIDQSSVSQWETGKSFPDIQMLPRLAALYNVSLDELLGPLNGQGL